MLFLYGFALSLLGSLPPGLISLSVAQTAVQRGLVAALVLSAGAAAAEFFQAWLAAAAAGWFVQHPLVEQGLHWASVPIFIGLGLYLIFKKAPSASSAHTPTSITQEDIERALEENPTAPSGGGLGNLRFFFHGIVVSLFNLLAIPYWLTYCSWLRTTVSWQEGWISNSIFSAGVTVGTFAALSAYAGLGYFAVQRSDQVARYINRIVGLLFFGLGLKLLLDILT